MQRPFVGTTNATKFPKVSRLLAAMEAAVDNNPYQRAAMTSPPVITTSPSSDGTLGSFTFFASGNALSPAAAAKMAWYGGVPTIIGGAYIGMPVASVLPSTAGNCIADLNSWASAFEFMTDAQTIEFDIYFDSSKKLMFQVDGQYVDFVGTAGPGSPVDTFVKLPFSSKKVRRIRVLLPTVPATGPTLPKAMHMTVGASFWKPSMTNVFRAGFLMDSYGEGTNGAASIYPIPNAAWPVITAELLGIRDCRQLAVGSTGYLSNASGTRSKLRDQLPNYVNQAPFDLIVIGHGYNDASSTPAAVQAEAVRAFQDVRALLTPTAPIVVLGTQAGAAGPSAQQIATENAVAAAVAQFNDPLCVFHPVSTDVPTWLNGTGKIGATNSTGNSDFYVDPDGAHPSGPNSGAEYLAYRSARAIRSALASMVA